MNAAALKMLVYTKIRVLYTLQRIRLLFIMFEDIEGSSEISLSKQQAHYRKSTLNFALPASPSFQ